MTSGADDAARHWTGHSVAFARHLPQRRRRGTVPRMSPTIHPGTPDPDFEARVRDSFARQIARATLGATLSRVEAGAVDIALPFRHDLTQQHGFLHAGILATILDSACGYAGFSKMPAGAAVLSIEF